jgi:hypothetical protein
LPLKNRRGEYSWPQTRIDRVQVLTDKRDYERGETIGVSLAFRVVGGLRESFHPDVWTVAWEDFDKIFRLTFGVSLGVQRSLSKRKLAEIKKEVRKASYYWSRDPDLPYRVWAMIIPEDGGPPKIPHNVEDAKSKMLDVEKTFKVPAFSVGKGKHKLVGSVRVRWPRRSYIEKGGVSLDSKPAVVNVA